MSFVRLWVWFVSWINLAVCNSGVSEVLGKIDFSWLTNAGVEFNPLVGLLLIDLNERFEWEREMVSVDWKRSVLLIVPSVVLRAGTSTGAGSVEEENTVWSSGSVSWIKLTILLLSNVMLMIQESVLGGSDDWVVNLWWLGVYGLTSKLVSGSSIGWEVVW